GDRREQVVEGVPDPAPKPAEALEPVHLLHAPLERAPLLLFAAAFGEIAADRDEAALAVGAPVREARALVPHPVPVVAPNSERPQLDGLSGAERRAQRLLDALVILGMHEREQRHTRQLFVGEAQEVARHAALERAAAA